FTEFLPISSTGHMIIVSDYLGMVQNGKLKSLEMMIQFFAILAILFIYKDKINFKHKNLWFKIIVAFLPLGVIGFIFSDFIKSLLILKLWLQCLLLVVLLFCLLKKYIKKI
ncbi:undecaprenol kinase, partial [sediment metagenome]